MTVFDLIEDLYESHLSRWCGVSLVEKKKETHSIQFQKSRQQEVYLCFRYDQLQMGTSSWETFETKRASSRHCHPTGVGLGNIKVKTRLY